MLSNEKRPALIAIDLGAQSCRVSLLRWNHDAPEINLVHRFPNAPIEAHSGLCWKLRRILEGIHAGLHLAANQAPEGIVSVALDGWAVDYVRILENAEAAADPFCYRDSRTDEAQRKVHAILPPERLYSLTGIQILRLNTLYQLYADKLAKRHADLPWLNVPEYISHHMGGQRVSEYTNATHTGLVSLDTRSWCREIFESLAFDPHAAPTIVPSGTVIGTLQGDLARVPQFKHTKIVVPACHDTASAIAAIPAAGDDWAFISSGTWSLVGTVLAAPNVSAEAQRMNFTNLGGIGRTICFLKNVNGMWLLQQCLEEWERLGHRFSLREVIDACVTFPKPACLIDVDAPELMLPGKMLEKIGDQLESQGQRKVGAGASEIPAIVNLLLHSLAARYAAVLSSVEMITGKKLKRLFIVGGGNQNHLLNRLTAERTGLEVILGPAEASTIGNFAVQLATLQGDWDAIRGVSAASVAVWAEKLGGQVLAELQRGAKFIREF